MDVHKVRFNLAYSPLWIFSIALAIRALPEFLSGPYPVGYDLLAGYAPSLLALPDNYPLKLFGWAWSPLAIFILWGIWTLTHVDLFILLKVAGPVFYALFAASFYYLVSNGLGWSRKRSFATALLFLLQPAILRTGWDQLREELGFVFFFILLSKTNCDILSGTQKKPLMVVGLSLLLALSHQLVAILFFVVVFWQVALPILRGNKKFRIGFIALLPSAVLFTVQLYMGYIVNSDFNTHFVPILLPSGTNFFAFTNYFLSDPRFVGESYLMILFYVAFLSFYTVIPLIPLAKKGYFKDQTFAPMMFWLLIASYSIIVFPWFALSHYWWWILLLPIPLTVYVGQALERFGVFTQGKHFKTLVIGFLLLSAVAIGYASSTINLANSYMPSGLVDSCVPFDAIPDIQEAFNWMNRNLPLNAIVIVPEKFQGFASMYLRIDLKIRVAPPLISLSEVLELNKTDGLTYAAYYLDEVGTSINITILEIFGPIAVCSTLND